MWFRQPESFFRELRNTVDNIRPGEHFRKLVARNKTRNDGYRFSDFAEKQNSFKQVSVRGHSSRLASREACREDIRNVLVQRKLMSEREQHQNMRRMKEKLAEFDERAQSPITPSKRKPYGLQLKEYMQRTYGRGNGSPEQRLKGKD